MSVPRFRLEPYVEFAKRAMAREAAYRFDVFTTIGGAAVSSHFTLPFPLAAMATWNKELNLESARRLRALEPKLLAAGHGPPLEDPSKETVRAIERAHRALC